MLGTACPASGGVRERPGRAAAERLIPGAHMGGCQKHGPFLRPYYNTGPNTGPNLGDPKRDHNFDNPPHAYKTPVSVVTYPPPSVQTLVSAQLVATKQTRKGERP